MSNTVYSGASVGEHLVNDAAQINMDAGTKMVLDDNRVYRYTKNAGTNQITGNMVEGAAQLTSDDDLALDAVHAVGETTLTFTSGTTTAASFYVDGWCVVNKAAAAAGLGQVFQIATQAVFTSAAGDTIVLKESTPVLVALAASDEIALSPSPYRGVIVAPTTMTGTVIGVSHCARTALYWGWTQSGGVAAVNSPATPTVLANNVDMATAAAGRIGVPAGSHKLVTVGQCMVPASTGGEMDIVFLTLDQAN